VADGVRHNSSESQVANYGTGSPQAAPDREIRNTDSHPGDLVGLFRARADAGGAGRLSCRKVKHLVAQRTGLEFAYTPNEINKLMNSPRFRRPVIPPLPAGGATNTECTICAGGAPSETSPQILALAVSK
jgi:hypothetical protein